MLLKSIILPSMKEEEGGGGGEKKSNGAKARMLECAEPGATAAAGARVHTLRKRQAKESLSGLSK
jgi:hypothetical protein